MAATHHGLWGDLVAGSERLNEVRPHAGAEAQTRAAKDEHRQRGAVEEDGRGDDRAED